MTFRKLGWLLVCIAVSAVLLAEPGGARGRRGSATTVTNTFIDGFRTPDRAMPSVASPTSEAATIASLPVREGSYVLHASLVYAATGTKFPSRFVTCLLVPVNGPAAKAEWTGPISTSNTNTLAMTTTSTGAGTVKFRCTDADGDDTTGPSYRFLQLTAIKVANLQRTEIGA